MHYRILLALIVAVTFFSRTDSLFGKEEEKWAPDFILVGAQKSATGFLRKFIAMHPQVVWAQNHEVHFFDKNFEKGTQWYQNQFFDRPTPDHIIGEKTPAYMALPFVPKRIFSLYPKTKIIMILRNPVSRAYSHYQFNVRRGLENLSFEEAIKAEPSRVTEGKQKTRKNFHYENHISMRYSYLGLGIYDKQIQRWLDYFPREQILILKFDDLVQDPQKMMDEIFTFLGLPPFENIPFENTKETHYEPMIPATRQKLIEFFRPYNQQLQKLLDQEFPWDK